MGRVAALPPRSRATAAAPRSPLGRRTLYAGRRTLAPPPRRGRPRATFSLSLFAHRRRLNARGAPPLIRRRRPGRVFRSPPLRLPLRLTRRLPVPLQRRLVEPRVGSGLVRRSRLLSAPHPPPLPPPASANEAALVPATLPLAPVTPSGHRPSHALPAMLPRLVGALTPGLG
ncbi:hypothetical protein BS78_01G381200 [Paspalum vaginatum]|nr:hypothetical protein BS78_01G381200 [Paspalum vaginatum]